MPINTNVSNLPSAPNRSGSPSTFASDTDAFLAALPTLQSEINAYAAATNSTGDQISEYLSAAEQGAVTGLDVARWDNEVTYARFDPVIGSDSNTYRSLVDNNLGNDPTTDGGDNWLNLSEVSLAPILKPELLSPTDGETDIGETPTLDAGNYYSLYGRTHTLSRFQVATDQAFTSIVYDSGEIAATQTHTVPAGNLQEGQVTYYWRAYYVDDAGNQSNFSDPFEFVTADSFVIPISATGGTVTDITDGGVNYRVHTFTSSGTFDVTSEGEVEYLIVAGGGGGGSDRAGGGGAGGLLQGVTTVSPQSYTVTVGAGGAGGPSDETTGSNGSDSSAFTENAIGGGGGGHKSGDALNGGSGGGGGCEDAAGSETLGGSGTSGQGNDGADGFAANVGSGGRGGGGGGAGSAGQLGSETSGGDGGNGIESNISGSATYYAGGGGGGIDDRSEPNPGDYNGGSGGLGGGGNGGDASPLTDEQFNPQDGTNGTGGGGGGSGLDPVTADQMGGDGGSGIVIIRYQI